MRARLRNTWPVLPSHMGLQALQREVGLKAGGSSAPEVGVAQVPGHTHAHPFISRAGAQQGWSGPPLQELLCFRVVHFPHLVSGLQITGDEAASLLPTEQRDLGIAGSLGYPSSWNAPPSRLLTADRAQAEGGPGGQGLLGGCCAGAGAMNPWTPGSEKIVRDRSHLEF